MKNECWVGKRNLEEAIKACPGDVSIDVVWSPFFLNPSTPEEGIPLLDYLASKYGPQAAASAQSGQSPVSKVAEKLGLKFDTSRVIVNTFKSHCLLDYAKTVGKQNDMAEVLFDSYFQKAKRIDHVDVLKEAAESCGVDWSAAQRHMTNAEVQARVRREASAASAGGINGVPHFNVYLKANASKAMQLSGAQPSTTILTVFQRLLNFAKSRV